MRLSFIPNFTPCKCKSGRLSVVPYPQPMKIKIRCKSGVVAMNFRRKSKGSFEYSREASYLVCNFMCEKGDLKFVNVFKCKNT